MFTIEQIKSAHAKVRSGADFPQYISDIKQLGVVSYITYVSDGHTDFYGPDVYRTSSGSRYESLKIAKPGDAGGFKKALKTHQQGGSTYPEFCAECAKNGVYRWVVDIPAMNCTYYDGSGNALYQEAIPG